MNKVTNVYDCFTFFNEFELLDLRFELLNDYVDFFVIVEANKTFQGAPRDLLFEKENNRYAEYLHKIIYVKVEDMPEHRGSEDWSLEFFQRNSILKGLSQCNPNDLIIISDIDEIPNPESILNLKNNQVKISYYQSEQKIKKRIRRYLKWFFLLNFTINKTLIEKTAFVCQQELFYYYLNCKSRASWNGSIFCLYKNLGSPQRLRDKRNKLPRIINGGWHFSYLGGIERITQKLESINEGANANSNQKHIEFCLKNGIDIYGRKGLEYEFDFIKLESLKNIKIKQFANRYPKLVSNESESRK